MIAVLLLLIFYCWVAVMLLINKWYWPLILLVLVIYASTFVIGRKFSRIFFALSLIKYIRGKNGRISLTEFQEFINKGLRGKKTASEISSFSNELITILENEQVITVSGETVFLTTP